MQLPQSGEANMKYQIIIIVEPGNAKYTTTQQKLDFQKRHPLLETSRNKANPFRSVQADLINPTHGEKHGVKEIFHY